MIGVHLDRESTQLHEPLYLTCKFRADAEMVLLCQQMGERPHRGTPIGKLKSVWPFETLKKQAIDEAKTFIGYMIQQGYEPREPETTMELWGPYREKLDLSNTRLVNWEEGNHLIPQGHWGPETVSSWVSDGVQGPRVLDYETARDHRDWKRGVVFLIRGKFLASYGHENETGTLII